MEEKRKDQLKNFMKKEFNIEIDDEYIEDYDQALTHYNDQRTGGTREPERLAFLGDSYLEFIVRKHLFNYKPDFSIGEMNNKKELLVENEIWKKIAEEIGLGEQIVTVVQGTGCSPQRFENKIEDKTILARSFEALAGVLSHDTKDNPEKKLIALFIKRGYLHNHSETIISVNNGEFVSFFVNGKPSPFATAGEKPWRIKLEQQIPDSNKNGLEKGMVLDIHVESMKVKGHYFDVDNLCEPVFSILINKKGWFKGKRPNIQWFRASKIESSKSGCDFKISDSIEPSTSVNYKNQIYNKIYSGNLPKSATDIEFISWIKENYTPIKNNNSLYLKIEFSSSSMNLGEIATGKVKSIIDCLYPIIGGNMGSPEDWRFDILEVKKGVETIPENSIRVSIAEL